MAKIFALYFALVALVIIAESKSLGNIEESCHNCAEEVYKRTKRAEAPAILNSISGLVNGILDTNWSYITRLNAQKLAAQRKPQTVVIGPGRNNNNRVMINRNYADYNDYNDYSGGAFQNKRNQRNQRYQRNQRNQRHNDYNY